MTADFPWRRVAIALAIGAVLLFIILHVTAGSHRNEGCGPVSPKVCEQVRISDEDECQAGEGCGLPLERKP